MGEKADRQRIKALLKENNPSWKQTFPTALKMRLNSSNNLEFIPESLGVSQSTFKRWFAAFRKDGIEAALHPDYRIGRPSLLDKELKAYLLKGLENARWNTAEQAREELEQRFKRNFTYVTVWNWLKKCSRVLRVLCSVHERKNSCRAEAFKRDFLGFLKDLPITGNKALKLWPTIESLNQVVGSHLQDWCEAPEKVLRLFGKSWICLSANNSWSP